MYSEVFLSIVKNYNVSRFWLTGKHLFFIGNQPYHHLKIFIQPRQINIEFKKKTEMEWLVAKLLSKLLGHA